MRRGTWSVDYDYDATSGVLAGVTGDDGTRTAWTYERDRAGRVTSRTERVGGETRVYEYGYGDAGRLASVERDGVPVASYAYDPNGNRTSVAAPGADPVTADYDDQDRLLRHGTTTYRHTSSGELRERTTAAGESTLYSYDAAGNLTDVELPGGRTLTYLTDGVGRRIGTKVDGVLQRGFVYGETGLPSAELTAYGQVRSRFVYGTRTAVPEYMQRGGRTYRIVSDQLGSVRLVVDAESGEVAQRIDYDAETGRWTAKDPVDLAGPDTNLYGYVMQDPINRIDPTGLLPSFEDFANSTVGSFDSLTFGYTKWVRDRTYGPLGLQDGTAYCSFEYRNGHLGGQINRDFAVATFTGNGLTGLAMFLGRGPVAAGMIGGGSSSAISTALGSGGDPVQTVKADRSARVAGFGRSAPVPGGGIITSW